jgi:hypothetical protein
MSWSFVASVAPAASRSRRILRGMVWAEVRPDVSSGRAYGVVPLPSIVSLAVSPPAISLENPLRLRQPARLTAHSSSKSPRQCRLRVPRKRERHLYHPRAIQQPDLRQHHTLSEVLPGLAYPEYPPMSRANL